MAEPLQCCYGHIYKKDWDTLHRKGYEISAFVRTAVREKLARIHDKITMNRLSSPIQIQELQADPAKSPHRASSDPILAPKLPEELYKLALAKQNNRKKDGPILD
jgi:hypothetical protein